MTAVSPHWIRVTHPLLLGPTLNIDGPGRIDSSLILDDFALELVWYRVILSNLVCKSIQASPPPHHRVDIWWGLRLTPLAFLQ